LKNRKVVHYAGGYDDWLIQADPRIPDQKKKEKKKVGNQTRVFKNRLSGRRGVGRPARQSMPWKQSNKALETWSIPLL
jgi:hypothetical protein